MARPTRVDFPGAWYHVLNRGIEKRAIFRSGRCYEKVIELLSSVPKRFGRLLTKGSRLYINKQQDAWRPGPGKDLTRTGRVGRRNAIAGGDAGGSALCQAAENRCALSRI